MPSFVSERPARTISLVPAVRALEKPAAIDRIVLVPPASRADPAVRPAHPEEEAGAILVTGVPLLELRQRYGFELSFPVRGHEWRLLFGKHIFVKIAISRTGVLVKRSAVPE